MTSPLLAAAARRRTAQTDPWQDKVVAHLRFDGNLIDLTGRVWTAYGNAAPTAAGHDQTALALDGVGDYLGTPATPDLDFGATLDLTVEAWVYCTGGWGASQPVFYCAAPGWAPGWLLYRNDSDSRLYFTPNGTERIQSSVIPAGTWAHVVITRASGVWMMFIDGIKQPTTWASAAAFDGGAGFKLGGDATSLYFKGRIDDFRLTRGVARYINTFTPTPY